MKVLKYEFDLAKKVSLPEYVAAAETISDAGWLSDGDNLYFQSNAFDPATHPPIRLDDGTGFFWAADPETPAMDLAKELTNKWFEHDIHTEIHRVDWEKVEQAQELINQALSGAVSYFDNKGIAVVVPPRP